MDPKPSVLLPPPPAPRSEPVAVPQRGDFITRIVKIAPSLTERTGRKDKALYQFPMGGQDESIGPCGSQHIRGHRTKPYMRPLSACMFTAMAQEWRQKFCPGNGRDCRLMFGDTSYGKRKPRSWPHATHHDGQCIDVWPVRKPGSGGEVRVGQRTYDSERTADLISLMVKWGAETTRHRSKAQFFFNDPKILKKKMGVRHLGAHYDHIHVCFRPTQENYRRCKNFTLDVKTCPTMSYPEEIE